MKNLLRKLLLGWEVVPLALFAQTVDTTKYTDYTPYIGEPDPSLLVYGSANRGKSVKAVDVSQRPDHVNNMESRCFPPVFSQSGGSCGSASRIGYMFTHEMNAYRGGDGSLTENLYPTHFVWLFTKGNSGKDAFMTEVGIPNAVAYGGRTYSALFGNQSDGDEAFGWMNGYDKWYSGMFNRMSKVSHIPASMGTPEGREAMKNWLWNHNGDVDYMVGGLGGIGVATGSLKDIPSTPANDENGLTGLKCVNHWGDQVNHALTLVGYDDRVEFDLDGDGRYGEPDADEKGAWIIVNSWGTKWGNGGAIYCPYAYGGKRFDKNADGSYTFDTSTWWVVEVLSVRKDYRPLRTIRLKMDYTHRSEMALSAGVSADINATEPDRVQKFHHFQYAGDGARGTKNPAPAVPMLGRWADGKLHDEPMEFGYDLTDLTADYDRSQPLKYFFIIDTREWGIGSGHIYDAAIMDYEFDPEGVEFPFDLKGSEVKIESQGHRTVITAIVQGEGYNAPRNLALQENMLTWEAPQSSMHEVVGYKIYKNKQLLAEMKPSDCRYQLESDTKAATYGVTAVYGNAIESASKEVMASASQKGNTVLDFSMGGFTVPGVFHKNYSSATIEFWISPRSRENGVFDMRLDKSDFFLSGYADGKVAVGWDDVKTSRFVTSSSVLPLNKWTHLAVVIEHKKASLFVNGGLVGTAYTQTHDGVNSWDELEFAKGKKVSRIDAFMDEIKIWNYAKSRIEIRMGISEEYLGPTYPAALEAYYKGDFVREGHTDFVFDVIGGNHGMLEGNYAVGTLDDKLRLHVPDSPASVEIISPTDTLYAGQTFTLKADYGYSVESLTWTVLSPQTSVIKVKSPELCFANAGTYEITVEAKSKVGDLARDTCQIEILPSPAASADFTLSKPQLALGERLSSHVAHPVPGYRYVWTMPGAEVEKVVALNAVATYSKIGDYDITLAVCGENGVEQQQTQRVSVMEVAPEADFELSAGVVEKGNTVFLKDVSKFNPTSWQWTLHSEKKNLIIEGQHTSLTLETPGVYDVALRAANNKGQSVKSRNAALVVCNADSKTGLNFGLSAARVVLSQVPFVDNARTFTVEWWMCPDKISTYCNGMGESEQTFLLRNNGDGILSLSMGGKEVLSGRKLVIPYSWHHYAVTFNNGEVKFYRDGVLSSTGQSALRSVPAIKEFSLGLEHMNMSGIIDEFRIWGDCLTESEIQQYANAPIVEVTKAETDHHLSVYYDFNQGSGDVLDATSHANTGLRRGFGPDGDAWSLSSGVFCLNFEEVVTEDVSSLYLKNYKAPFAYDGDKMTHVSAANCHAIADWTLENAPEVKGITGGVYVDSNKKNLFTCQTGWQEFPDLVNHKAFQTVTLPAGSYEFIANYGYHKSAVKNIVLAAALGTTLPDAKACGREALASMTMAPRSASVMSNKIDFFLKEPTEVSLGLVINMSGKQCFVLNDFELRTSPVTLLPADGAVGYDLSVDASGYASLYLPYAVNIPEGATAYVASSIEGSQVTLTPIADGVIPAHTGVVVMAKAGIYRFSPTSSAGKGQSLLKGSYKDVKLDSQLRYYLLDTTDTPCFKIFQGEKIPACQAYFTTDLSHTEEIFNLNFVATGIGKVERAADELPAYDVVGRPVSTSTKGVRVTKHSKQLVK